MRIKPLVALLFWIWEFDDVRRTHSIWIKSQAGLYHSTCLNRKLEASKTRKFRRLDHFLLVQSAKESTKEHAQFTGTLLVLCCPLICFVMPCSFLAVVSACRESWGHVLSTFAILDLLLMNAVTMIHCRCVPCNADESGDWPLQRGHVRIYASCKV